MFVNILWPSLQKQDTNMRESIKLNEIILILRYFAGEESYRSLEYQFRISRKTISYIIDKVAQATLEISGRVFKKSFEN